METKTLYKIGACCWLLADFLSDDDVRTALNTTTFKKIYSRLKEKKPEFEILGALSLTVSAVSSNSDRYCQDLIGGKGIGEKAKADAVEQFAESATYLESWLDTLYAMSSESKKKELNSRIQSAVAVTLGKEKQTIDKAIDWISLYPADGGISAESVLNKLIQLKNET